MSIPNIRDLRRQSARRRMPGAWLRWVIGLAVAGALFLVTGFLVAPPIVRSQLQKRLSAELKRDVTVEKVRINPLTLSASLEGLRIKDRKAGEFVTWRRLFVNFDSFSLLFGEWRFQEIALDDFSARIAVDAAGKLNFSDLLTREGNASKAEKPRPIRVKRLSVAGAKIDYEDQSQTRAFKTEVGPLTFTLTNFHTGGELGRDGHFTATTEAGESLAWRGTLALAPLRSAGEITVGKIALKKYEPYYRNRVQFTVLDGTMDVAANYQVSLVGEKPVLKISGGKSRLASLQIAKPGAAEPVVSLSGLEVSGVMADSAAMSATVERIALTGGRVVARRSRAGIDLQALFTPSQPPGANVPASGGQKLNASATMPDVRLGELVVDDFGVALTDETTARPAQLKIDDVKFTAKNLALAALDTALPVEFSAIVNGKGRVNVNGTVAVQPLKADVAVQGENISVIEFSPYVELQAPVRLAGGSAGFTARVQAVGVDKAVPVVTAHGEATLADFAAVDARAGEPLAGWTSLVVRGIDFSTAPARLTCTEIEWTKPSAHLVKGEDGVLNLVAASSSGGRGSSEPQVRSSAVRPAAKANEIYLAVDKFTLNGASVEFVDRSVQPHARAVLTEFTGVISGLSSSELARADVQLKGLVGGTAPVAVTGRINPLAAQAFTDLKVDFSNIDLSEPAGPYIGKYAGYFLERGALTLDVKAKVANRRVNADVRAVLEPFTLGESSGSSDATKLPVKFALSLLRDVNGRIEVPVPIDGSLDDPNFRVGRVVLRVVVNLLTKAATSPFALVGAMFGGGQGEELAQQQFAPGLSDLDEHAVKKLEVVAKAMRERPGLKLEVMGGYDARLDVPALREREFARILRHVLWEEQKPMGAGPNPPDNLVVSPKGAERLIAKIYREMFASELPPPPVPTTQPSKAEAAPSRGPLTRFHRGMPSPSLAAASAKSPVAAPVIPPPASRPAAASGLPSVEQMRARILGEMQIDETVLGQLADERARRVKEFLVTQGQVSAERVAVMSETTGRVHANGPRVDLQLK